MSFKLRSYQQFQHVLQNYQISERAKDALADLKLVLMVAPSSTGRNTIIKELLETGDYYFIISDTTRPPQLRDGAMEENGVQYFFRNEEEMLADLETGEFLEAALIHEQQISGISIRELEKAKKQGKIAITDIEIVGADNVMRVKSDALAIFVLPPSFEEWQRRMTNRGEMSPQEETNRLTSALKELEAALKHDYYQFIVADDIPQAAADIHAMVKNEKTSHDKQTSHQLAEELYGQLQDELRAGS